MKTALLIILPFLTLLSLHAADTVPAPEVIEISETISPDPFAHMSEDAGTECQQVLKTLIAFEEENSIQYIKHLERGGKDGDAEMQKLQIELMKKYFNEPSVMPVYSARWKREIEFNKEYLVKESSGKYSKDELWNLYITHNEKLISEFPEAEKIQQEFQKLAHCVKGRHISRISYELSEQDVLLKSLDEDSEKYVAALIKWEKIYLQLIREIAKTLKKK